MGGSGAVAICASCSNGATLLPLCHHYHHHHHHRIPLRSKRFLPSRFPLNPFIKIDAHCTANKSSPMLSLLPSAEISGDREPAVALVLSVCAIQAGFVLTTKRCKFLSQEVREKMRFFCCAAARVFPLPPLLTQFRFT